MSITKKQPSFWSILSLFCLLISAIVIVVFHKTHANTIDRTETTTATTNNQNGHVTKKQNDAENKTNYRNLSPKDAYNKGIEYSQQSNVDNYNIDKAVDYIQYSAATGYAEAQFKLGLMYFQGLGVQSNPAVGFYWIEKAAKNDYPHAQIYLAYMYKKGIGVSANLFKSNYWLRQARENGIDVNLSSLPFF
ncbi:tetratricopeptide repeat protein [Fastidiosibacter lacustris]|uniref:tetratricopeptide repeat protein n=1 Tax=Fastidiosibacter lacustris TaxID=2056695 RepID=UPI000E340628|nr:tetratricopeptide repeat protein [Fastidiosibacter lacustris]